MKNDKNMKKATVVNAGQRRFDPGQNAAKRGQQGQGGGDVIADVTGSKGRSGSNSVRVTTVNGQNLQRNLGFPDFG